MVISFSDIPTERLESLPPNSINKNSKVVYQMMRVPDLSLYLWSGDETAGIGGGGGESIVEVGYGCEEDRTTDVL